LVTTGHIYVCTLSSK